MSQLAERALGVVILESAGISLSGALLNIQTFSAAFGGLSLECRQFGGGDDGGGSAALRAAPCATDLGVGQAAGRRDHDGGAYPCHGTNAMVACPRACMHEGPLAEPPPRRLACVRGLG